MDLKRGSGFTVTKKHHQIDKEEVHMMSQFSKQVTTAHRETLKERKEEMLGNLFLRLGLIMARRIL